VKEIEGGDGEEERSRVVASKRLKRVRWCSKVGEDDG
jgi:hypothetical protein